MSDDRKVCGRCLDWNQGTVTPRHGYCRVHDRFKEYSDTCDQFRVSQWFADQAELAALRARAERAEAEILRLFQAARRIETGLSRLFQAGPRKRGHAEYIDGLDDAWAELRAALAAVKRDA